MSPSAQANQREPRGRRKYKNEGGIDYKNEEGERGGALKSSRGSLGWNVEGSQRFQMKAERASCEVCSEQDKRKLIFTNA